MTALARIAPAQSFGIAGPPVLSGKTAGSLMPTPPDVPRLEGLELMYLLEAKGRQLGLREGKAEVLSAERTRKAAEKKEMDALLAATDAAQHHNFWDDVGEICLKVAKVAAVVVSIAVAVCSFGAGTPLAVVAIAGAVMSTAGFVQGEAHVLEKLGLDAKCAGFIGAGLSLAGATCTGGAGLAAGATEAGAEAAMATKTIVETGAKGAAYVAAAGHIAGGMAKIEAGSYAADAEHRYADALQAQNQAERMRRQVFQIIDQLRDGDEASQRKLDVMKATIETKDATLAAAAVRV